MTYQLSRTVWTAFVIYFIRGLIVNSEHELILNFVKRLKNYCTLDLDSIQWEDSDMLLPLEHHLPVIHNILIMHRLGTATRLTYLSYC